MIGRTVNIVLERWNELEAMAAAAEVLPCCGSRAWSRGLAGRRPFVDEAGVVTASDAVWEGLEEQDWLEAFGSHPRIGERHATGVVTAQSLAWSDHEQRSAASGQAAAAQALAEGNRRYEAKFGRTFIVCASGRSGDEILANLNERMRNDPGAEMREAAEQQRLITRLRLGRWMRVE